MLFMWSEQTLWWEGYCVRTKRTRKYNFDKLFHGRSKMVAIDSCFWVSAQTNAWATLRWTFHYTISAAGNRSCLSWRQNWNLVRRVFCSPSFTELDFACSRAQMTEPLWHFKPLAKQDDSRVSQLRRRFSRLALGYILEDGQGMGLGVEDPLVERDLAVVAEEEVEVLERLRKKERLLHIIVANGHTLHVSNARVTILDTAVLFNCLDNSKNKEGMMRATKKKFSKVSFLHLQGMVPVWCLLSNRGRPFSGNGPCSHTS